MKQKYWHLLSKKEKQEVLDSDILLRHFLEIYKQPDWCKLPLALEGMMGCWSLCDIDKTINEEYCKTCEMHKNYKKLTIKQMIGRALKYE